MKPRTSRRQKPLPAESLLVRPLVQHLHPYVPGEQPKVKGLIKLNTNENPYPPSPKVIGAIRQAVDQRLRLYPNPTAEALREKLAKFHGCRPENILVGNGSDEILALASRAFVEPVSVFLKTRVERAAPPPMTRTRPERATLQYFTPSYSLYPVLADIHAAWKNPVPLNLDFALPSLRELKLHKLWDFHAALTYITTPNAPSGRGYRTAELELLCRLLHGVVVLDEAYVDFAEENALSLALKYPNVLVARTFSKAYSLCFQRVGYAVGSAGLIGAMQRIRDSYNVNGLGQVGAEATLDDLPFYRANFQRVIATRQRLATDLTQLGFSVFPSQANFLLVRPPRFSAPEWLEKLRAHKILVRWWDTIEVRDYLRITIGTDAEVDTLLRTVKRLLGKGRAAGR